jgi:hypothetical protein
MGYKHKDTVKTARRHVGTEAYNDFVSMLEERYEEVKESLVTASFDDYHREMRGAALELKALISQMTDVSDRYYYPADVKNIRNDLGGY